MSLAPSATPGGAPARKVGHAQGGAPTRRAKAWVGSQAAGLAVLCLATLLLAGAVERRSEQRANRLHREGAFTDAAQLYGDRVDSDSAVARLRYNFGTTLLDLGSPSAVRELERASAGGSADLRANAFYNLGRWFLVHARDVSARDSAMAYALGSVDANKSALRLEPGRADARWNLALAQRMLDSINASDGRAGTENVDGANDSDERVLSDELREFQDENEVIDAPREGADEALAQGDDSAPLSELEADRILVNDLDRSVIVRKLLTYESRAGSRRLRMGRPGPRW